MPAFQSLPWKPKARRLKSASVQIQGDARTGDLESVRSKKESKAKSRSIAREGVESVRCGRKKGANNQVPSQACGNSPSRLTGFLYLPEIFLVVASLSVGNRRRTPKKSPKICWREREDRCCCFLVLGPWPAQSLQPWLCGVYYGHSTPVNTTHVSRTTHTFKNVPTSPGPRWLSPDGPLA